ncbi:MAG TPA: hypothetical protein VEX39_07625 [Thermoleophilaceae bacterium]|nr:hypothetical protein [Thermoleophilaceae bacterium]
MSNHTTHTPDVTVRLARSSDTRQLFSLAALDSASLPQGELVVAESEGRIVAALPVAGGPAIADPFHRTAALVQMLELRAQQLRATSDVAPGAAARIMAALNRPALRPN